MTDESPTAAHEEGIRKLESMLAGTRMHATRAMKELHERMLADLHAAERRATRAERRLAKSRQRTQKVRAELKRARQRARRAERATAARQADRTGPVQEASARLRGLARRALRRGR